MKNIKLTLEYIGTNYAGFQVQKNAVTIEEKLAAAIEKATQEKVKLTASGRTDAGVHATGQVVNFFSATKISLSNLPLVINKYLPSDIKVISSKVVKDDFDARKSATKKTYKYKVITNAKISVFEEPFALFYPYALDYKKMEIAAKTLEGEHDFAAFMASGSQVKTTIRTILKTKLKKVKNGFEFSITGSGFLYNMVRIIVGTLLEVGTGKKDENVFIKMIESKNRALGGKTAAACGLYLEKVVY